MTERVIGYSGLNYAPDRKQEMEQTASALGITMREIPLGSKDTSLVADCEALFGDFDASMIEAAGNMKWFHSHWAGVDDLIKLEPFKAGRAVLTNSSGAYNTMIVEHLLGGCLTLLRNFPAYVDAQRKHVWQEVIPADSLWNKRITVLGVGNIGGTFAKAATGLGAQVSGLDLLRKDKPEWLVNLYSVDQLDQALENAEILVMCLPYTKETDKFIGAEEIAKLPKGTRLLNTGRGKTLDVDALAAALRSGHLAGAMLDVFPVEPLLPDDPLWDTPNLFITPHVAGHDADKTNAVQIYNIFMRNLQLWAKNEPLTNVVNVERGF